MCIRSFQLSGVGFQLNLAIARKERRLASDPWGARNLVGGRLEIRRAVTEN